MNWLKELLAKYVLGNYILKIKGWLEGKKTIVGAISFLLWVTIYALPAFTPNYNWVTHDATIVRDFLLANGINLDNTLFNAGTGFTIIGLIGKVMNYLKKDNTNEPG